MGEALLRGLLRAHPGMAPQVVVSDCREARRDHFVSTYKVASSNDNGEAVHGAEVVVLAVKPGAIAAVLAEISAVLDPMTLVISIAAGVTLRTLEASLPARARVCRAMPNTPALVGAGATAVAPGSAATTIDLGIARALFASVGVVVEVTEPLLDAVTGLSGSGPAYVAVILEALADAGVRAGLSREVASFLATHTVLGGARLIAESAEHPAVLKDRVASPAGTTIAGLYELERGGLRAALMDAVAAAVARARELGGEKLTESRDRP